MASRPTSASTRPGTSPLPRTNTYRVNTQTKVLDTQHGRILCVADVRGKISSLNELARDANAQAIIHTGDFGFFEASSVDRINERTLRHLTMYSPLIPSAQRTHLLSPDNPPSVIRATVNIALLSEFPLLLSGQISLDVPVYTVWGACEDVDVLEKFRSGTYSVPNLHVLDEATTRVLDVGGVRLRLLGLGGALVPHKLFDNGEGHATIAGGQGTMWTTALQIGELVDTAQRVYDPSETRLFVSHASPGREGVMASLALAVRADLTISAGLHFRYGSSYNEFSVQNDYEAFTTKLQKGREAFNRVWESVQSQVYDVIDEQQRVLLDKALAVVERTTAVAAEETAWKNCWNWNLCDAAYGSLVLDVKEGRVSAELKSQGFNYAYRRTATQTQAPASAAPPSKAASPAPAATSPSAKKTGADTPAKPTTPAPAPANNAPSASQSATPDPQAKTGASTPGKADGTATPALSDKEKAAADKAERERQKKKEKNQRKKEARAAKEAESAANNEEESSIGAEASSAPTAAAAATESTPAEGSIPVPDPHADLKSPATDSTGTGTPTRGKSRHNPWTLFMRMNVTCTEADIREFYGDAKEGIIRVVFPLSFAGRNGRLAYVEFGDEAAMKEALEKKAEKINDDIPEVKQATDRENREGSNGYRGGGRGGRGGRGRGGFVSRGFAAAGLTGGGKPGDKRGGNSTAE